MAGGAVLIARIGHIVRTGLRRDARVTSAERARPVMALQAKCEGDGTPQQTGIRRAMRTVAHFAAIHARGGMFKEKRPALVGVAAQAGLLIRLCLIDHAGPGGHTPGWGGCAVRVVAIRALHKAFVDAMLERHSELTADLLVALVADIDLSLGQQELWRLRFVDRVAIGADDAGEGVRRAADVRAGEVLIVASEAAIENPGRLHERVRVRNCGLPAARFDVFLSGPVAAFTTGALGRLVTGGDTPVMRILIEVQSDVGMTSLADRAAHVLRHGGVRGSCGRARLCQGNNAEQS